MQGSKATSVQHSRSISKRNSLDLGHPQPLAVETQEAKAEVAEEAEEAEEAVQAVQATPMEHMAAAAAQLMEAEAAVETAAAHLEEREWSDEEESHLEARVAWLRPVPTSPTTTTTTAPAAAAHKTSPVREPLSPRGGGGGGIGRHVVLPAQRDAADAALQVRFGVRAKVRVRVRVRVRVGSDRDMRGMVKGCCYLFLRAW